MTTLAWIIMFVSVSFVCVLMVWCFYRVLTARVEPPEPVKEFHSA